ncbi:MAG: hypothetical protein M3Y08_20420, partial [Fibrobacterota bacterium]|nr:hypothetical protein [Fibrobacterota bacterium]
MNRTGIFGIGAALGLALSAHANLDMSTFSTQTVKQNQTWAVIDTKVETLDLKVEVNNGVVTTTATFAYTPGPGYSQWRGCVQDPCKGDTCLPPTCDTTQETGSLLDSLETSAWFNLKDNAAITDMYLWVGDVKVKANLQERALASAQYEDIVKRRKDPALIETWGGGSYSLRIFPNQSKQTRKIEIQFVQGMGNNGDAFNATLPIIHSLVTQYQTGYGWG